VLSAVAAVAAAASSAPLTGECGLDREIFISFSYTFADF